MEKMTRPAKMLVLMLLNDTMSASLHDEGALAGGEGVSGVYILHPSNIQGHGRVETCGGSHSKILAFWDNAPPITLDKISHTETCGGAYSKKVYDTGLLG